MRKLKDQLLRLIELIKQLDISQYYGFKDGEYILLRDDMTFPEINSTGKHFDAMKIYMFCYELAKVLAKNINIQENKILFKHNDLHLVADMIQQELSDKWPNLNC